MDHGALDVVSGEKSIILEHPEHAVLRPHFSPDGRFVAFEVVLGPERVRISIAPFRGSSPVAPDAWTPVANGAFPRFSPDGARLYFLSTRDGYPCLWQQKLDPDTSRPVGEPRPVHHMHGARRSLASVPASLLEISVARDQIVFPIGERTGNIWMAAWDRHPRGGP